MKLLRVLSLLWLVSLPGACTRDTGPPSEPRDLIVLRWIKAYPEETRAQVEKGVLWGLSLLGADVPSGRRVLRWDGNRLTVDVARAQVEPGTLPAWRELIAALKASDEYRVHHAIDIGRFLALTLGNSEHYFALTGALTDYEAARQRYRFDAKKVGVEKSSVAHGSRLLELSIATRAEELAAVAFEGEGSLAQGTFVPHEREIIEMMANGQLRFALYDLDGHLKRAATPALTAAGKPAKCMWCHESGLTSTIMYFPSVPGHYGSAEFDALIAARRKLLGEYRNRRATQIDFRDRNDHTSVELLYLTFEAPSLARLAGEWGVSEQRAAEMLRGKPTHPHEEFAMLGAELYRREDVDALAPYPVLAAPRNVRELTDEGVTLIRPAARP